MNKADIIAKTLREMSPIPVTIQQEWSRTSQEGKLFSEILGEDVRE